jgi:dolichol-phosphate mannosyltransferase
VTVPAPLDLSIVIPAWNERTNLELLMPAIRQVCEDAGLRAEVIVVDGGSDDGTSAFAARLGARVIAQRERGYGAALREGIAGSRAPWVATMDADLSHRPVVIEDLWRRREEADVLIASRYVPGGESQTHWVRRALSRMLNVVYARALSIPIRDLSSGFRMYRRSALADLALTARDFDILPEIVTRLYADGYSVREVPFRFLSRGSGRSHIRLFRFALSYGRTLGRLWRLRNSVDSADYDHRAFDSVIPLQRYWQRARHRVVLGFAREKGSVLDIGCGSSRIIRDLPEAVGLDIQQRKLRFLARTHRRLVRASLDRLPFRDGAFGTVICSEVIEHVPDSPEVLGEMTRVLRPGGTLVLGTPDYGRVLWRIIEWFYGKLIPGGYAHEHITHFTRASLAARLAALGYHVTGCRYVGFCEMIFQARKSPDGAAPRGRD